MRRPRAPASGPWLHIYRIALYLYPPSFRVRCEARLTDDVAELLCSERQAGGRVPLRVLVRIAKDLLLSVPREWH